MSLKIIHTFILAGSAAGLCVLSSCANKAGAVKDAAGNKLKSKDVKADKLKFPLANPLLDAEGKPVKNVYISPFSPHNPIDTKGYYSGSVVGDPSTMSINPKTGKPDTSTIKAFRIP